MPGLATLARLALFVGLAAGPAGAQGPLGNLLGGELIDPRPGIYAWYEVEDAKTGQVLFMRQAIVGEERVGRRDGYWLEIEIVPREGIPAIYKMLVTGPASDRDHLHKVVAKPGAGPRVELPVDELFAEDEHPPAPQRLGEETISTQQGEIPCVRYALEQADGSTVQVWLSDLARPTGLVKMESDTGRLILTRTGEGGPHGATALPEPGAGDDDDGPTSNITVRVEPDPEGPPQRQGARR